MTCTLQLKEQNLKRSDEKTPLHCDCFINLQSAFSINMSGVCRTVYCKKGCAELLPTV